MSRSLPLPVITALVVLTLGGSVLPASAQSRQPPPERDTRNTTCTELDMLPRIVRPEQVSAIPPGTPVTLRAVCAGDQFVDFGNAGGLGREIGANPTLEAALRNQGWTADDVVGIDIHSDSVDLYVHGR